MNHIVSGLEFVLNVSIKQCVHIMTMLVRRLVFSMMKYKFSHQ